MSEAEIKEVHGVCGLKIVEDSAIHTGMVLIKEGTDFIRISLMPDYKTPLMTPAQARRLARQLVTLARRIEARNA